MANYVNTGNQRSLTISLAKKINGVVIETVIHDGRLAFGSLPAISNTELVEMPFYAFTSRLEEFKSYVENIENGLIIDECIVAGEEAYRINTTMCPIGA